MGGGAGGAGDEQRARRILVEPVDEFGPAFLIVPERIEQPVDMVFGLGSTLSRESRRLVEDQGRRILVND